MRTGTAPSPATHEPIFVSVADTMKMLGLSRNQTYRLLNNGRLESRYFGRRRLVLMSSINEFAQALPAERPLED
jgi:predicted DNA-binding transcriptional regulator AlpA